MSGIVGVIHCTGEPVERNLLIAMSQAIAHRGPDGEGYWIDGPVGLGHRLLHTTPESLQEIQPLVSDDGSLVIVCDARIDNRTELTATLVTGGIALRTNTDAELILKAYEYWGTTCPQHLLGDFAFVIWNQRERRLFCARDPIGVKPFYYYWDGCRLLFASEIRTLLGVPGLAKRMNDAMIADYLLWDFRHPDATFFEGIMQLRPGHWLGVEHGQMRLSRYWDPEPTATVSYPRDRDYFEHFRELFREAVRCRLRSHFPVGVMLSGGIDSTLVTAMAETVRREQPEYPPLAAFTLLYEDVHQEDRKAIERLVREFGLEAHLIPPWTNQDSPALSRSETPGHAFLAHRAALDLVVRKSCRVLLTGFGADELLGMSELGILKDLLRGCRLMSFHQESRRMARAGGTTELSIVMELLRDWVPCRIRWLAKALLRRQVPYWIEPDLVRRLRLSRRVPARMKPRFPTICQEESLRALTRPRMTRDLNLFDGAASDSLVEWRYPFLDRRLIEFFLSVPFHVKMQAGPNKRFAQLALGGVAPGPIREEREDAIPQQDGRMGRVAESTRIRRMLGPADGPLFRYVRFDAMPRLVLDYVRGNLSVRTHLWRLRDLHWWMQQHFPETMTDAMRPMDIVPRLTHSGEVKHERYCGNLSR